MVYLHEKIIEKYVNIMIECMKGICLKDHLEAATDLVIVRMGTEADSVCCRGPWACLIARLVRAYNSLHPVRASGSSDGLGRTCEKEITQEERLGWLDHPV